MPKIPYAPSPKSTCADGVELRQRVVLRRVEREAEHELRGVAVGRRRRPHAAAAAEHGHRRRSHVIRRRPARPRHASSRARRPRRRSARAAGPSTATARAAPSGTEKAARLRARSHWRQRRPPRRPPGDLDADLARLNTGVVGGGGPGVRRAYTSPSRVCSATFCSPTTAAPTTASLATATSLARRAGAAAAGRRLRSRRAAANASRPPC